MTRFGAPGSRPQPDRPARLLGAFLAAALLALSPAVASATDAAAEVTITQPVPGGLYADGKKVGSTNANAPASVVGGLDIKAEWKCPPGAVRSWIDVKVEKPVFVSVFPPRIAWLTQWGRGFSAECSGNTFPQGIHWEPPTSQSGLYRVTVKVTCYDHDGKPLGEPGEASVLVKWAGTP